MKELSIGEVARQAGLAASALRYYERAGLLPAPPRRSRQRRYTEAVFGRISLIRLALEAGFTIGGTPLFLFRFFEQNPPGGGWGGPPRRQVRRGKAPNGPGTGGEDAAGGGVSVRVPG